ncbi:MAG: hypothetical protein ACYCQJ_12485 [Nitrososphaerales archaeon]
MKVRKHKHRSKILKKKVSPRYAQTAKGKLIAYRPPQLKVTVIPPPLLPPFWEEVHGKKLIFGKW